MNLISVSKDDLDLLMDREAFLDIRNCSNEEIVELVKLIDPELKYCNIIDYLSTDDYYESFIGWDVLFIDKDNKLNAYRGNTAKDILSRKHIIKPITTEILIDDDDILSTIDGGNSSD